MIQPDQRERYLPSLCNAGRAHRPNNYSRLSFVVVPREHDRDRLASSHGEHCMALWGH
jgi:hypothetical protein